MSRLSVCPHCGKSIGKVSRLNVSVPAHLASFARDLANKRGVTVSSVVAEAVIQMRDAESGA